MADRYAKICCATVKTDFIKIEPLVDTVSFRAYDHPNKCQINLTRSAVITLIGQLHQILEELEDGQS